MHDIEPYYSWRHLYISSEDERSPLYNRQYSEIEFTNAIYDHLIHPQWDEMGSATLYLKILYVNYPGGYAILEMMGEWNDCLYNDIMYLKRNIIESMIEEGINKFILIGENVLNFHASEDDYYQEWFDEIEDGWIAAINFRPHVLDEFTRANIDFYIAFGGQFDMVDWRTMSPTQFFNRINQLITKRLTV
ncbi:MAG: hypothetical protein EOM06_00770 [Sphingobacteriia bacterium]|nr:hypothetical protein [Sphingobacteriia bacterium]HPE33178.1 hypothetical protein [Bacteroidales bacterium]HPR56787.1 hypothetical protein [Bacteroidales bacterium]HRW95999.1 hypothetical protein [Bacteroidales bacterium]